MDEPSAHVDGRLPTTQRFAAGVIVVGSAMLVAVLSRGFPNGVLEDDAYFYLRIADHLARGLSSFDGREVTNGYHPLWAWLLAGVQPAAWAAGPAARIVAVFTAALLSGAMLWRIAGADHAPAIAVASAITLGWLTGILMEGVLAALLLALLVAEWEGARRSWPLGALAVLLPLARLEMASVPLVLGVAVALCRPAQRRPAAALTAGALAGLLVLVAWNLAVAGCPLSISSVWKAGQVGESLRSRLLHNATGGNLLRWLVVVVVSVVSLRDLWRRGRRGALVAACTVLAVLVAVATVARVRDWYFAPAVLFTLSFVPWGCRRGALVLGVAAISAAALAFDVSRNAADARATRAFVERVNAVHPRTESIYQVDGSGFTGFWLDAPVVNGDGVVNSFEHLRALREHRLVTWLQERHIHHVILNWPDGPDPVLLAHADLHLSRDNVREIAAVGPVRNRFSQFRLMRVDSFGTR